MEEKKTNKYKIFAIVITTLLAINMVITGVLLGFQINSNISKQDEQTKYTLYIGTNDKDTYKLEIPFEECMTRVTQICVKHTSGCTIYEATGYWMDDNNNITTERTIAVILEDISKDTVYKICDEVIVSLNQNSILIETGTIKNNYYSTSSTK